MNPAFCTIITPDYIRFAGVLNHSIRTCLETSYDFIVFVAANKDSVDVNSLPYSAQYLFIDDLCDTGHGREIFDKYYAIDTDHFRWSMKPVLMRYLLESHGYGKVIYTDWDIHFYGSPLFLIELLDRHNVLLSPHFRSSDPVADYHNYILHFNDGIFNGGFVAASRGGTDVLTWWASNCLAICERNPCKGQFVDQTHLNLIPVFFEKVFIIQHRGCNVANWNLVECRRDLQNDGSVLINGQYPIIFIHFTQSTINGVQNGEDANLVHYLQRYVSTVQMYAPDIDILYWKSRKISGNLKPQRDPPYGKISKLINRFIGSGQ